MTVVVTNPPQTAYNVLIPRSTLAVNDDNIIVNLVANPYRHIRILCGYKSNDVAVAQFYKMVIGGDNTAANYIGGTNRVTNGVLTVEDQEVNYVLLGCTPSLPALANVWGQFEVNIYDIQNTSQYKSYDFKNIYHNDLDYTQTTYEFGNGVWLSLANPSSVDFRRIAADNLIIGSWIECYGFY